MIKKIIQHLSSVNQVLFFIIAIMLIASFVRTPKSPSKEAENKKEPRGVRIQDPEALQERVITTRYFKKLKDVLVFWIEADYVDPSVKRNSALSNIPADRLYLDALNILFVSDTGNSYTLFDYDRLIRRVDLLITDKYNLYVVVDSDTNSDGFLGDEDSINLYISDYNGKNCEMIFEDMNHYKHVDENKIMIVQDASSGQKYYLYHFETNELKMIDTEL